MEEEKKELLEGETLDNVSGGFVPSTVHEDQQRLAYEEGLKWERTTTEAEKQRKHERKMEMIKQAGSLLTTVTQQVGENQRQAMQTGGEIVGGLLGGGGKK